MTQVTKLGPGGYPVGILGPIIPTFSYVSLVKVIEAWQPEVWPSVFERGGQQPYQQGQLAALATSIINTPIPDADSDVVAFNAVTQWQPEAWPYEYTGGYQPYGQLKLASLTSQVTSNPLPNADALTNLMELIGTAWQPPDPLPTLAQKRAPGSGLSVDNPPTLVRIFLPPVDNVFPAQPLPKLVPIAVAGQVPYASQALVSVLAWQPPDFIPQARTLLAALPGMSVDNPPTLRRLFLPSVDPDLVIQPRSQVAAVIPAVAAFVPSQSAWLASIIQSWVLADPAPQIGLKLPPALIAVRVDNPPFIIQGRFADIWSAWEPGPPQPQQGPLIVTPGPLPSPFLPFGNASLTTILEAWQQLDSMPQRGPPGIPVLVTVHNLPFIVTVGKLKAF